MRGIERFVVDPVGIESFGIRKKEWIAAAIGAVGGLASSFFGGSAASKAAKEAERRQRNYEASRDALINRELYQDYAERPDVKRILQKGKSFLDREGKKVQGTKAVMGTTDAASQMSKDSINKAYGDMVADASAMGAQAHDRAVQMKMNAERESAQMDMNRELNRANQITNAAQNASNAIMQGASAFESGTNLAGGSNKGTVIDTGNAGMTAEEMAKQYAGMLYKG